jgi:hypothetical protein
MKKGAVISTSDPLCVSKISSLNPTWYYTWGPSGLADLAAVPFTSMCWGANSLSKVTHAPVLLGFNEPDGAAQSNLTVEQALSLWPRVVALGDRIGSPATAGNASKTGSWLETFMASSPKVDFVCVHWYAPPNADSFLAQIDAIWAKYGRPIWVTEFAPADWNGKYPGGYPIAQVEAFMKAACAGLESRSYVERYAWKTRATDDVHMGSSALFNADGSLTELGEIYSKI